ncbi:MAG TPA: glycoside hydrolase family 3 N-terminal domain-containing protein, partial [Thermomicrobiales bacterium]|nr:glycoside hydrolase family 3 N-terminal domain-containing protein [Thermomicrobiales bacterium]
MSPKSFESLVDQLTLEEQISLMAGAGFWQTASIDRLGIPAIKVSDGPNGARGAGAFTSGVPAASFPVGISLASTWNLDLASRFGAALAAEVKTKGAQVVLAPTLNIHRSPLGGRNFESFSEDPLLAGRIGAAIVNALQANGIAATVKHFTGNESEFERNSINSIIDERTLREIYLRPFEIVSRLANPWAYMTAYNQLNGTFCCQNPRLLGDILRGEWGFDGMTMSDWVGTKTTVEAANAGLDLEMPGPTRQRGSKLSAAVASGSVSRTAIRTAADNVLRLIDHVDGGNHPASADERAVDLPETRALIRAAGAQGIVLLKNQGVLPLSKTAIKSVAAIGPNADVAQIMGGGSSQINAHYRISPLAGLDSALGNNADVNFAQGCIN